MSQHQAGFAGVPVKRLKKRRWHGKSRIMQPASWQEVMQDMQSVAQIRGDRERLSSPKVWLGDSSVDSSQSSDLGGTVPGLASWDLIKGISHFISLMQSMLSSSSTYMTSVGSRGAGLPYKNIRKLVYLFILKQWYMHTYLHTTVCVCMDTHMYTCWNIIKQLLNSKGDAGLPDIWLTALKLKMPTL